jgi:hypothetical protein
MRFAMDDPLMMLGFLSIFHVIGAVALANGLRSVWRGLRDRKLKAGSGLFFVLWGTMFGCMPFAFGLGLAADKEGGTPLVLLGEALVWGSVFLIALLAWDEILDWLRPFLHPDMFLITFGGIFMAAGMGAGSFIVRDDVLFGVLFGGIFTLVGGVIFAIGVWHLLKEIN